MRVEQQLEALGRYCRPHQTTAQPTPIISRFAWLVRSA